MGGASCGGGGASCRPSTSRSSAPIPTCGERKGTGQSGKAPGDRAAPWTLAAYGVETGTAAAHKFGNRCLRRESDQRGDGCSRAERPSPTPAPSREPLVTVLRSRFLRLRAQFLDL